MDGDILRYILYNPLSNKGKCIKFVEKLAKKYQKRGWTYQIHNLVELRKNTVEFIASINEKDEIVIVGGDGTLHYLANEIDGQRIANCLYYLCAGTGNDFARDFKENCIKLNDYLFDLPVYEIDEIPEYFLNCAGVGIDGEVCSIINQGEKKKSGLVYFWTAIKAFLQFKRYDLTLTVDNAVYHFSSVLFATVMNGQYFGGGMKMAPGLKRNDDILDVYIIHRIKLWRLFILFPLIFLGWHMHFSKHGITHLTGRIMEYELSSPRKFEADGEMKENISKITFYAKKRHMKTFS